MMSSGIVRIYQDVENSNPALTYIALPHEGVSPDGDERISLSLDCSLPFLRGPGLDLALVSMEGRSKSAFLVFWATAKTWSLVFRC